MMGGSKMGRQSSTHFNRSKNYAPNGKKKKTNVGYQSLRAFDFSNHAQFYEFPPFPSADDVHC